MQTMYATHLLLPASAEADSLSAAISAVSGWAQRRFRVQLAPLAGGRVVRDGVTVEWTTLLGADAGLFGLWVDQSDSSNREWRWRTYIDVGVESGTVWVRVRVHLYSAIEGLITQPNVDAGRPGVVRDLVRDLGLRADELPMGSPFHYDGDSAEDLLRLLTRPSRRLPVVVLSTYPSGATFIDAEHLADRLLGLAHVAKITAEGSRHLTASLGQPFTVYGGAIRVFWPSLTTRDDPRRHRLFAAGALAYLGPDGVAREIFDTLGRLAGLSVDEPSLRRRLIAEARANELAKDVEERAATLARLNPTREPDDTVSADDYEELFTEYERLDATVTDLREDALARDYELESLEFERDDAREQLAEILDQWRRGVPATTDDDDAPLPPATVLEAVERAAADSVACLFLPEAFVSAGASGYRNPQRVYDDLMLVDDIAAAWQSGSLASGPHAAFKEQVPMYREGIGQIAETRYRVDYERIVNGESILLAPHIRRGVGAVTNILRIYMHFDSNQRRIIIGHVGRKLRDTSNRN